MALSGYSAEGADRGCAGAAASDRLRRSIPPHGSYGSVYAVFTVVKNSAA